MSLAGQKEAIYLFDGQSVVRGYWLSEFERVVREQEALPVSPVDGQEFVKAAYVVIGPQDFAQAMVLFTLPVGHGGGVRSGWYLPLHRLADTAGRGPNMGDGRIRLACRSQCPVSWHTEAMWEPVTSDFMAIRKAIRDQLIGKRPVAPVSDSHISATLATVPPVDGAVLANAMTRKHDDPEIEALKAALRSETHAYGIRCSSFSRKWSARNILQNSSDVLLKVMP